jgi:hypothetical protein
MYQLSNGQGHMARLELAIANEVIHTVELALVHPGSRIPMLDIMKWELIFMPADHQHTRLIVLKSSDE